MALIQPGQTLNPGGQYKPGPGKPPKLLRDMRLVYSQGEAKDTLGAQRALRQMYKDDPPAFLERLRKMEEAWMRQEAAGKPGRKPKEEGRGQGWSKKEAEPEGLDVGSELIEEMLEKLIGEANAFSGEVVRAGAKGAAGKHGVSFGVGQGGQGEQVGAAGDS